MTLAEAITALTDLGLLPVITLAASLGIAGLLYRKFRR
jgi:hypothetical protein